MLLVYDGNDRFNLRGSPTTIAVFEAVLAEALNRTSPGLSLAWSNYRPGSDRCVTELLPELNALASAFGLQPR